MSSGLFPACGVLDTSPIFIEFPFDPDAAVVLIELSPVYIVMMIQRRKINITALQFPIF
jgi:hypothetical protein